MNRTSVTRSIAALTLGVAGLVGVGAAPAAVTGGFPGTPAATSAAVGHPTAAGPAVPARAPQRDLEGDQLEGDQIIPYNCEQIDPKTCI